MPSFMYRHSSLVDDESTRAALVKALQQIVDVRVTSSGFEPGSPVLAERKRNVMKNRWAMTCSATVSNGAIRVTIEGMGNAQRAFADEIWANMPPGVLDDHNLPAVVGAMSRSDRLFGRAELGGIAEQLHPGEQAQVIATGTIDGSMGVVIVTDQRVVLYDKTVAGSSTKEVNPAQITSIGVRSRMGVATIELGVGSTTVVLKSIEAPKAEQIADNLRARQRPTAVSTSDLAPRGGEILAPVEAPAAAAAASEGASAADELRKLADLHAAGIITDAEFAAAKARMLGLSEC